MSEPWYKTPLGRAVIAALPEPPKPRRAFAAAQQTSLTYSWGSTPTHVNADLQRGLSAVRARSRDLERNNDYARKFLSMVETNVVGHAGFSLFVEPRRPDGQIDQADAARIEAAFWQWARECEVTGLGLAEVQRLFIRTVARDGEVGVRFLNRGPYGVQMQLVDPCLVDEQFNGETPGGGKIRMGVEYDSVGAVVAYHVTDADSADPNTVASNKRRQRIPAADFKLYFPRMQIGQLRGVPFMASALLRLQMLAGYEEAAVVAARVGAAKMGVIKTPDNDLASLADEQVGNTGMIDSAEPGGFFNLPAGAELQNWNPEYPHQQFGEFIRATLRGISSGLGVAYPSLANDLENVNYSSIRAGVLEEREVWKALQNWMIDAFLAPMFTRWLRFALTSGALQLPASKFDKFNSARWLGRRWDWVDPEKDMAASVLAIRHGLKSRSEIVAEQGRDLEDVWNDLANEQAIADAKGIKLADIAETDAAVASAQPAPAPAPTADPMRDALAAMVSRETPAPVVTVSPPAVTVNSADPDLRTEQRAHNEAVLAEIRAANAAAEEARRADAERRAEADKAERAAFVEMLRSIADGLRNLPAPVVNVAPTNPARSVSLVRENGTVLQFKVKPDA